MSTKYKRVRCPITNGLVYDSNGVRFADEVLIDLQKVEPTIDRNTVFALIEDAKRGVGFLSVEQGLEAQIKHHIHHGYRYAFLFYYLENQHNCVHRIHWAAGCDAEWYKQKIKTQHRQTYTIINFK